MGRHPVTPSERVITSWPLATWMEDAGAAEPNERTHHSGSGGVVEYYSCCCCERVCRSLSWMVLTVSRVILTCGAPRFLPTRRQRAYRQATDRPNGELLGKRSDNGNALDTRLERFLPVRAASEPTNEREEEKLAVLFFWGSSQPPCS